MESRVKKTRRYRGQKPGQVKEYWAEIVGFTDDHIAYVDETGIDNYLHREYGWSERGKAVMGAISGRKFNATQRGKSIVAPLQYEGTMDSTLFA